jgi:ATP-dependent DNA helicase PIF1
VSLVPGEEREYLSCDKIAKSLGTHGSYDLLYPIEFLNSLNGNNFPHHRLLLKKGVPIMMLRNLDQSGGLCNGTRLVVTNLGDMLIEAKIMIGTHAGDIVHIPRICLTLKKYKVALYPREVPVSC